MRHGLVVAFTLSMLCAFGCGTADPGPVALRIGDQVLSEHLVDHWTTVFSHGGAPAGVPQPPHQAARQQALSFLILSSWLIDEAAEHGLRLARHDLERRVQERQEAVPNGRAEFQASLRASGRTIADVEFEIDAQWAAAADRRRLLTRAGETARSAVTSATVASYYRRNIARYRRGERRDFDIAERIPSKSAASRVAMQIRHGKPFTGPRYDESFERPPNFNGSGGKGPFLRAVFSAKVGALEGPLPLNQEFALFVLRRVRPATTQPLATVSRSIEARLVAARRAQAFKAVLVEYEQRWRARTFCGPRYIVPQCNRSPGTPAAEDTSLLLSEHLPE
jgi:hypothetical protein